MVPFENRMTCGVIRLLVTLFEKTMLTISWRTEMHQFG